MKRRVRGNVEIYHTHLDMVQFDLPLTPFHSESNAPALISKSDLLALLCLKADYHCLCLGLHTVQLFSLY